MPKNQTSNGGGNFRKLSRASKAGRKPRKTLAIGVGAPFNLLGGADSVPKTQKQGMDFKFDSNLQQDSVDGAPLSPQPRRKTRFNIKTNKMGVSTRNLKAR